MASAPGTAPLPSDYTRPSAATQAGTRRRIIRFGRLTRLRSRSWGAPGAGITRHRRLVASSPRRLVAAAEARHAAGLPVTLARLGTARPPHELPQTEVLERARRVLGPRFPQFEKLAPAHLNAGVDRRRSVAPFERFEEPQGGRSRNDLYLEGATALCEAAARAAPADAGRRAEEVAVAVAVAPTGVATPTPVTGEPVVARGPFAALRHPDYALVVAEIAVAPLVLGLVWAAAVFSAVDAAMPFVRIRAEDAALGRREPGQQRVQRAPRHDQQHSGPVHLELHRPHRLVRRPHPPRRREGDAVDRPAQAPGRARDRGHREERDAGTGRHVEHEAGGQVAGRVAGRDEHAGRPDAPGQDRQRRKRVVRPAAEETRREHQRRLDPGEALLEVGAVLLGDPMEALGRDGGERARLDRVEVADHQVGRPTRGEDRRGAAVGGHDRAGANDAGLHDRRVGGSRTDQGHRAVGSQGGARSRGHPPFVAQTDRSRNAGHAGAGIRPRGGRRGPPSPSRPRTEESMGASCGILTVSWGGFRCRLEGFEEPMAALADVLPWLGEVRPEIGRGPISSRGAPGGIRREFRNGALVLRPVDAEAADPDGPEPSASAGPPLVAPPQGEAVRPPGPVISADVTRDRSAGIAEAATTPAGAHERASVPEDPGAEPAPASVEELIRMGLGPEVRDMPGSGSAGCYAPPPVPEGEIAPAPARRPGIEDGCADTPVVTAREAPGADGREAVLRLIRAQEAARAGEVRRPAPRPRRAVRRPAGVAASH